MKVKVSLIIASLTIIFCIFSIVNIKGDLKLKEDSILELESKIESKTEKMTELEIVLMLRDKDILAKSETIEKSNNRISEKNSVIDKQTSTIEEKDAKIEEKDAKIKELNNIIISIKKKETIAKSETVKEKVEISRGNDYKSSVKTFIVQATAYTAYCNGCSGVTKTGINLRKNPSLKVIAVDPKIIPLNSIVQVTSTDFPAINGQYIAGDTGGDIKKSRIDIFMPSKELAYNFGRRDVKVQIIREGK